MTKHHHSNSSVPHAPPHVSMRTDGVTDGTGVDDPFAQFYYVNFAMTPHEFLSLLYIATLIAFSCWCFAWLLCCVPERFKKAIGIVSVVCGVAAFVLTIVLTDRMEDAVIHARHFVHKTTRIINLINAPIEDVH